MNISWNDIPDDLRPRAERHFSLNKTIPCALTLNVYLEGSQPPIWRRIVTRNDISLHQFHQVLQIAMGWQDEHIYEFELHELRFMEPDGEDEGNLYKPLDSTAVTLSQIVNSAKTSFQYTYDLGQEWKHKISFVSVGPIEENTTYPYCVMGDLACPPENSGGTDGYYTFLEDLERGDQKSEELREWLVECDYPNFDPSLFDIEKTNKELSNLFKLVK